MAGRRAFGHGARTAGRTTTRTRESLPLFASAMRKVAPAVDLERIEGRPEHVPSGLRGLDLALRGGFPVGAASLIAARPKVGATSLLMGLTLAALERGEKVAYFSEHLTEDQLRGRLVVLAAKVNGHRFAAGFVSAEDRIALAVARERIPWGSLVLFARRAISVNDIDREVFSYRPLVVVADVRPRAPEASNTARYDAVLEGAERLSHLSRRHRIALLQRWTLPRAAHAPDVLELPGLGQLAAAFGAVVLLHRHAAEVEADGTTAAEAEARVVRVGGHEIEPRVVPLRFDQRFAGFIDPA